MSTEASRATATAAVVPPLFTGLLDDAAVFPPGNAALSDAVAAHRDHQRAWYAPLIGVLLVPASRLDELAELAEDNEDLAIGLVADRGVFGLDAALAGGDADRRFADRRVAVRQVEVPAGADQVAGLHALIDRLDETAWTGVEVYVEISRGSDAALTLDVLAEAYAGGRAARMAAKFRTGGADQDAFPSPDELAALIGACRDRRLPFKCTAGLHHLVRHTDPKTGLVHHGFLNVLTACVDADAGADEAAVADRLAGTDPEPLVAAVRELLPRDRPLWTGFGTCSIDEPLADLLSTGLLAPPTGDTGGSAGWAPDAGESA